MLAVYFTRRADRLVAEVFKRLKSDVGKAVEAKRFANILAAPTLAVGTRKAISDRHDLLQARNVRFRIGQRYFCRARAAGAHGALPCSPASTSAFLVRPLAEARSRACVPCAERGSRRSTLVLRRPRRRVRTRAPEIGRGGIDVGPGATRSPLDDA